MAKKMPKTQAQVSNRSVSTATVEETTQKPEMSAKTTQKAAVAVDSKKAEPKKTAKNVKKQQADKKPNIFRRMWKGLKGIFSELKKVTWPKGKDVLKSTTVVFVVVFAFFIILFGIDYVLAGLLSLIVNGTWATIFI